MRTDHTSDIQAESQEEIQSYWWFRLCELKPKIVQMLIDQSWNKETKNIGYNESVVLIHRGNYVRILFLRQFDTIEKTHPNTHFIQADVSGRIQGWRSFMSVWTELRIPMMMSPGAYAQQIDSVTLQWSCNPNITATFSTRRHEGDLILRTHCLTLEWRNGNLWWSLILCSRGVFLQKDSKMWVNTNTQRHKQCSDET